MVVQAGVRILPLARELELRVGPRRAVFEAEGLVLARPGDGADRIRDGPRGAEGRGALLDDRESVLRVVGVRVRCRADRTAPGVPVRVVRGGDREVRLAELLEAVVGLQKDLCSASTRARRSRNRGYDGADARRCGFQSEGLLGPADTVREGLLTRAVGTPRRRRGRP